MEIVRNRLLIAVVALGSTGLLSGCHSRSRQAAQGAEALPARVADRTPSVRFVDVTTAAGIHFRHTNGRSGRLYFAETAGSGCAFLDYNNDGRLDLFLVNGTRLPGFQAKGPFYSALYRNDGNGHFTDVTRAAGLALECYGMGVAVADYDGDGFQDLYLTALGPNHLFHNRGDGRFEEVTERAGVGDPRFSTSAAWLDYDRDGWLDLFVCNYCRWSPELDQLCPDAFGGKHNCGPSYYKGVTSTLYRNNGDGTFTDVTKKAGLDETVGKALGIAVWDFDDDGWLDLGIARDKEPNSLYRGSPNGRFTDVAVEMGVAYSRQGQARSGMGIDTGDIHHSGRESILIGNLPSEGLAVYTPDESGHFSDTADPSGLLAPSLAMSTFATLFLDYDGDGWKDCFAANGHVDETLPPGQEVTFAQPLQAFRNLGAGKFGSVGDSLGAVFREKRVWRGLAAGDYDNDGDPDLLVTANGGAPALLRNEAISSTADQGSRPRVGVDPPLAVPTYGPTAGGTRSPTADGRKNGLVPTASREPRAARATEGSFPRWLQVRAIAAGRNRQGIGTRVTVIAGGVRQIGWIRSGSSYCSASDLAASFGLGSAAAVEKITLRWPDGTEETLTNLPASRVLWIKERG